VTKSSSDQPKHQPSPSIPSDNIPCGLARCPVCSEYRGAVLREDLPPSCRRDEAVVAVLCICDGIPCPECGTGRIHRPISNYWDAATATLIHCPWFSNHVPCKSCSSQPGRSIA